MLHCDAREKARFSALLLDWFARFMRPLPWRSSYDPYSVWISEIMLQQTRMERGSTYFDRWVKRFPDIAAVAAADEEEILKAWEGLGYYSRARNLHAAARMIVRDFGGAFPSDPDRIRALPGVGAYSAGAIASLAFNLPLPAVDANVERIFSRLCDIDTPLKTAGTGRFIRAKVMELMPEGGARLFNQALMEFGALVCGKRPDCARCPVPDFCEARRLGVQNERPVTAPKSAYTRLEMATGLLLREGRVFIQKRPEYGVWAGLWEFPGGCLEPGESPEEALVREFREETELTVAAAGKIGVVRHAYMTFRVTMHGFFCVSGEGREPRLHAASRGLWARPEDLAEYAFPAGHKKLLDILARRRWAGEAATEHLDKRGE
jgi:A/G-specific adenine glycosylase